MDHIKSIIRKGGIEEAINQLIEKAEHANAETDLIALSSRNFANERNKRLGIISNQDYNLTQNQITHELLNLIKGLEQGEQEKSSLDQEQSSQKKRIVFCEANPLAQNLFSNVEIREIEEIINKANAQLELTIKLGLSLEGFVDSINQYEPKIIHLTAFANEEGIYFHDKLDQPVQVNNHSFIQHFRLAPSQVECIFFNTFIAEEMAKELSAKGLFVIGYNAIINSYGAIEFATGFYNALRYGKEYATAFEIGYQTLLNGRHKKDLSKLYAYFADQKIIIQS